MRTRNLPRLGLSFAPRRLGRDSERCRWLSLVGATVVVAALGFSSGPPARAGGGTDIDFGVVEIGSSSERSAKPITTQGTVEVYSVVISGGNEGDFTIVEDT